MELKKVIRGEYDSLFYSEVGETLNHKTCVLLGYKEGVPVLSNTTAGSMAPTNTIIGSQTLRVMLDSKTGEKYVHLNGKKLRIVTESELPPHVKQNAQIIKVTGGGSIVKNQVKIKILSAVPSVLGNASRKDVDSPKTSVNNTDKGQISHKTGQIRDGSQSVTVLSASKVGCRDSAVAGAGNGRPFVKSKIISVQQQPRMNPLDLSKVRETAEVRRVEASVQTSLQLVDQCVQTEFPSLEEEFYSLFDNVDFNFVDLNAPSPAAPRKAMATEDATVATNGFVEPTKAHTEKFRMFFEDLRSAMVPDMNGNMPIHVGVLKNDASFVKRCCSILKALQSTVDILNHSDLTPLQLAVLNDSNPVIVKILLQHGAALDVVDPDGNNVVHLAIEWKRTSMLDIILRYADERKFNLDDFNSEGLTPLMMCCCNDLVLCAEILLKYDANVNVRDRKSGRTALFHAAENHNLDMVMLLLNYNANTKIKNFFGTSPHDAMYEVDDIPEKIKNEILGRNFKRKTPEEPKPLKLRRTEDNPTKLKTYARYKKITDIDMVSKLTTTAK